MFPLRLCLLLLLLLSALVADAAPVYYSASVGDAGEDDGGNFYPVAVSKFRY